MKAKRFLVICNSVKCGCQIGFREFFIYKKINNSEDVNVYISCLSTSIYNKIRKRQRVLMKH